METEFSQTFYFDLCRATETLKNGGIILYPTDTVWGLGCDATNEQAVRNIFRVKERNESKSLIILMHSVDMLRQYTENISEKMLTFAKEQTQPTTVIYQNPKNLTISAISADNTVAIRLTNEPFSNALIRNFGKPIISTSANISGSPTPRVFSEIAPIIIKRCQYVVQFRQNDNNPSQPSALVRFTNGTFQKIR